MKKIKKNTPLEPGDDIELARKLKAAVEATGSSLLSNATLFRRARTPGEKPFAREEIELNFEEQILLLLMQKYRYEAPDRPDESAYHSLFHNCLTRYVEATYIKPMRQLIADVCSDNTAAPRQGLRNLLQPEPDDEPTLLAMIREMYDIPDKTSRVADIANDAKFRKGINHRDKRFVALDRYVEGEHDAMLGVLLSTTTQLSIASGKIFNRYALDTRKIVADPAQAPEYLAALKEMGPHPFSSGGRSFLVDHEVEVADSIPIDEALALVSKKAKTADKEAMDRLWELARHTQMQTIVDVRGYDRILGKAVYAARMSENFKTSLGLVTNYCAERDRKYPDMVPELERDGSSVRLSSALDTEQLLNAIRRGPSRRPGDPLPEVVH